MPGELLESGAHSITVWFTQPEESGGSPVTGYKVQLQMEPDLDPDAEWLDLDDADCAVSPMERGRMKLVVESAELLPGEVCFYVAMAYINSYGLYE